jgi:hypothetical protein
VESFPYRYFDRSTLGDNASFAAGQYLQILPGITITCNSGTVSFLGERFAPTFLFLNGDTSYGIHVHSGAIKLHEGGAMAFPKK